MEEEEMVDLEVGEEAEAEEAEEVEVFNREVKSEKEMMN